MLSVNYSAADYFGYTGSKADFKTPSQGKKANYKNAQQPVGTSDLKKTIKRLR